MISEDWGSFNRCFAVFLQANAIKGFREVSLMVVMGFALRVHSLFL